jgi:hypothetical protein
LLVEPLLLQPAAVRAQSAAPAMTTRTFTAPSPAGELVR